MYTSKAKSHSNKNLSTVDFFNHASIQEKLTQQSSNVFKQNSEKLRFRVIAVNFGKRSETHGWWKNCALEKPVVKGLGNGKPNPRSGLDDSQLRWFIWEFDDREPVGSIRVRR